MRTTTKTLTALAAAAALTALTSGPPPAQAQTTTVRAESPSMSTSEFRRWQRNWDRRLADLFSTEAESYAWGKEKRPIKSQVVVLEAKRHAGGDESETKEEAREVAARGCAEVLVRFVQVSDQKRPRGASAVHLVEHGRTGAEHPVSLARARCGIEGELDRSASESAPRSLASGPTRIDPGGAPFGTPPVRTEGREQ